MKSKKKTKDQEKLDRIYGICGAAQKKYNMTDLKKERCIKKLKIKFGVKK